MPKCSTIYILSLGSYKVCETIAIRIQFHISHQSFPFLDRSRSDHMYPAGTLAKIQVQASQVELLHAAVCIGLRA